MTTRVHYWTDLRVAPGLVVPLAEPLGTYHMAANMGHQDTLQRVVAYAQLVYRVFSSSPPPDDWWVTAQVRLVLNWDPNANGFPHDTGLGSDRVIGIMPMHPNYYPSVVPNEYTVVWKGSADGLDIKSMRHSLTTVTYPQVLASIYAYDAGSVLDQIAGPYTCAESYTIEARALWLH